ncbi:MAG: thioredoxin family protein [Lentisphaeria bacterium]|nr:thioredoxin family protein [Lentisphaeria bacterium]
MSTRSRVQCLLCAVAWAMGGAVLAQDPFGLSATVATDDSTLLRLAWTVPPRHILYAHMLEVEAVSPEDLRLTPLDHPAPKHKFDDLLGEDVSYYDRDTVLAYRLERLPQQAWTVAVHYQGCDDTTCFLPQTRQFTFPGATAATPPSADVTSPSPAAAETDMSREEDWRQLVSRFTVQGTGTGYMDSPDFLAFLEQSTTGTPVGENLLERTFRRYGILVALLLVIPLGLLLNLTPCVLPMIPINLAIIGAGRGARSRRSGFLRGLAYGAGMALVYGVLGAIVVLTGSQFGALNASPWFNLAIALVFVVLGLAMFDVFLIDLSRFQKGGVTVEDGGRAPWITAFVLGGTAALLAGACVAPVLIWVLVLAANLYAKGNPSGLLLPLMLGVGMALPWPLAGAGMAAVPRPGNWMNRVKQGFGILIFLFAAYYAVLGVRLLGLRSPAQDQQAGLAAADPGWTADIRAGLREGLDQGKPVFLDFWALTCKSCLKMKKTTFRDPDVIAALDGHVKVAFQTDNLKDPLVKGILDHFGVLGLPTYIVLQPTYSRPETR